jgi:Kef-type K+ transport system membrane component KefB
VALGLGIVQDFSLAPMLALIPVIAASGGGSSASRNRS